MNHNELFKPLLSIHKHGVFGFWGLGVCGFWGFEVFGFLGFWVSGFLGVWVLDIDICVKDIRTAYPQIRMDKKNEKLKKKKSSNWNKLF